MMDDRRITDLVERWDELGWFDRKRICLICYKRVLDHLIFGNGYTKYVGSMEFLANGLITNTTGGEVFNWHKESLVGKNINDISAEPNREWHMSKVLLTGKPHSGYSIARNGKRMKFYMLPIKNNFGIVEKFEVSLYIAEQPLLSFA